MDIAVVLITYKRPHHTQQVLDALRKFEIQNLFIYSDGPKNDIDLSGVYETRSLLYRIDWTNPIIIERENNIGLASSITSAANDVFRSHDKLILLEDDCVPQKHFFKFMESCLYRYEEDENVYGVSGYTLPLPKNIHESYPYDLYFSPRIGSWGWGTWKSAWEKQINNLDDAFWSAIQRGIDLTQGGNDVPIMIRQFLKGQLKDVWTLNWLVTVYLKCGYYIYPTYSHIKNIGMDGTGIHCGKTNKFETVISDKKATRFPENVIINNKILRQFRKYYDVPLDILVKKVEQQNILQQESGSSLHKKHFSGNAKKNNTLRILQVADHQKTGGAAIAGHRLYSGLKSLSVNVELIPFNSPTMYAEGCSSWNQLINRIGGKYNSDPVTSNSTSKIEWMDQIPMVLKVEKPDIINVHNIHEAVHYLGVPLDILDLFASAAPLVFTLHDMWLLTGRCAYSENCRKFLDQSCNENCPTSNNYPKALPDDVSIFLRQKMEFFQKNPGTVIVTPSYWLSGQVKKSHLKNHRVEIIPYGVDTSVFRPDEDRYGLRHSIGISDKTFVILISAANLLDHRKGAHLLLEALSKLKEDITVFTVGRTNMKPKLPPNIKFYNYGFANSPEEMAFAYSVADLFVCPSLEDNLPCVLIESISCGTPCVGFNIGGVPEIIRPDKTGWIATETTSDSLSRLILRLAQDRKKIADLRKTCREVAIKEYALDIQAERYLKLYQGLIDQKTFKKVNLKAQRVDTQKSLEKEYAEIQQRIEEGNLNEALTKLENLVIIHPAFAIGYNDLGVLSYQLGYKNKAYKHYEKAVSLEPNNIVFLKNLADYYYVELGQIEKAMQLYVKALQIDPKDIEILMIVGNLCVALESFSEAKCFYTKILEIEPNNEEVKVNIEKLITKFRKNELKLNNEKSKKNEHLSNLINMGSTEYLVTAIVSTYNSEKYIRGCLQDLEHQTIADKLEIIVVNSGSKENEESIVRQFQEKYRNIKYIRTNDRETVYAAWNRGIKVATGKYLTNANTDDRHRNDAFEIMVGTLEKHPEVSLVYADVLITETENETFDKCTPVGRYDWLNWDRADLLCRGCFMGPQPMWRREIHSEYGYFDESLVTSGDYEFWLRISQTRKFFHIPFLLGLYLKSQDSIEHSNRNRQVLENNKILAIYNKANQMGEIIRTGLKSDGYLFKNTLDLEQQCINPESIYKEIVAGISKENACAAIDRLEKLLAEFPDYAPAHNDLGVLYHKSRDINKAKESYRRAIRINNRNIAYRKNLAYLIYSEDGKVEEALEKFLEIIQIKNDDIETLLISGHICVSLGKYEDAESFYNRIIEIEPDNDEAIKFRDALKNKIRENRDSLKSLEDSSTQAHKAENNLGKIGSNNNSNTHQQASIIMILEGDVDSIQKSYESILNNTKVDYELIFIKNGKDEDIKKWVRKTLKKAKECQIKEIGAEGNVAQKINQAMESAQGEYLVIIQDHLRVYERWLSDLIETIDHTDVVGVIGPITWGRFDSNKNKYDQFKDRNRHRRIPTRFIHSPCMVFKRSLKDSVGELSPDFTDSQSMLDDFCLRSMAAGYQNIIAGDVAVSRIDKKSETYCISNIVKLQSLDEKTLRDIWSSMGVGNSKDQEYELQKLLESADQLFQKEQIEKGIGVYLEGIRRFPTDSRAYVSFAEQLINVGRYQDALDALGEIPSDSSVSKCINPESIKLLMACCHEGLGHYEKAEDFVSLASEVWDSHPKTLNLKGILAYRRNDPQRAEYLFKSAIETDPGFGEPYTNLGSLRWESDDRKGALDLFERGFILAPTDIDIAAAYHEAFSSQEEFERAKQFICEALELYPKNKKLHYMLIDIFIKLGQLDKAMSHIEKSICEFGTEDGMLDAAMKMREKIGPVRIKKAKKKNASVSLCMIVKNEEELLPQCLSSVNTIVDEMIIVDTGSDDRTRDIAAVFGGRVFDFEWQGDFAEARNFSLSKAKGDWILIMDADEKISPQDYKRFRKLVAKKPSGLAAYSITTRNYSNMANTIGWIPNSGQYASEEAGLGWLSSEKVRLFSNNSQIKFEGAVHEMVDPVLKRLSVDMGKCPIPVHHYGRLDGGKLAQKDQAYYEIGRKKLLNDAGDIGTVRELAVQATVLERNSEAIELWQAFLSMEPGEAAAADAYVNMVSVYIRMKEYDKALSLARKAVSLNPQMKEAQYNLGITELYIGNAEAAFITFKNLTKSHPEFPPARFLLTASNYCRNGAAEAKIDFHQLKQSALGPVLKYSVSELAKGLMEAGQNENALNLLKNAIREEIICKDIMKMYAVCLRKTKDSMRLDCNIPDESDAQIEEFEKLN